MYDSYIKNKVIKEYKNGKSIINISKEFYIPYSTISDWIKKENIDKPIKKKTFKDAFRIRNEPQDLLFHSDQGGEYVSNDFQNLLATLHIRQSVSQPGMPYDNAVIESFYSIIKREEIYKNNYQNYNHLKESIADYINFYNNYRPHRTLNNLTPNEYEIRYFQNINIEN